MSVLSVMVLTISRYVYMQTKIVLTASMFICYEKAMTAGFEGGGGGVA